MDEQVQVATTSEDVQLAFERDDDFVSLYANNVNFEASIWDLKMIFGQLAQHDKVVIGQHTAITIPWLQAKILIYTLQVNVAIFEAQHGKIKIPDGLIPPEPQPDKNDEEGSLQNKVVRRVRQQFIESLK